MQLRRRSGRRKFDRVETTLHERYSIVYKDAKCGLYDNQADSLVTAVKYDELRYCGTESEDGVGNVPLALFSFPASQIVFDIPVFHFVPVPPKILETVGDYISGLFGIAHTVCRIPCLS